MTSDCHCILQTRGNKCQARAMDSDSGFVVEDEVHSVLLALQSGSLRSEDLQCLRALKTCQDFDPLEYGKESIEKCVKSKLLCRDIIKVIEVSSIFIRLHCSVQQEESPNLPWYLDLVGEQFDRILAIHSDRGDSSVKISKNNDLKWIVKAEKLLREILQLDATIYKKFITSWINGASITHMGSVGILLDHLKSKHNAEFVEAKAKVVEDFTKVLSSTKSAATVTPMWDKVIVHFDRSDWIGSDTGASASANIVSLETTVFKTVKKAPESSSKVAALILSNLNDSIEDYGPLVAQGFVPLCIRMVKSDDLNYMSAGHTLIKAVATRCLDAANCKAMITQMVDALKTTAQPAQRASLISALMTASISMSAVMPYKAVEEVGGDILGPLLQLQAKETEHNNRLMLAYSVGRWIAAMSLAHVGGADKSGLTQCLKTVITRITAENAAKYNSSGTTLFDTFALATALELSPSLAEDLPALASPLAAIISHALKKEGLAVHNEAVYALRILISVATVSQAPDVIALLQGGTTEFWSLVTGGGEDGSKVSFLYSETLLDHLTSYWAPSSSSTSTTSAAAATAAEVILTAHEAIAASGARLLLKETAMSILCIVSHAASAPGGAKLPPSLLKAPTQGNSDSTLTVTPASSCLLVCSMICTQSSESKNFESKAKKSPHLSELVAQCPTVSAVLLQSAWTLLRMLSKEEQERTEDMRMNYKTQTGTSTTEGTENKTKTKTKSKTKSALKKLPFTCVSRTLMLCLLPSSVPKKLLDSLLTSTLLLTCSPNLAGGNNVRRANSLWLKFHHMLATAAGVEHPLESTSAAGMSSQLMSYASSELDNTRQCVHTAIEVLMCCSSDPGTFGTSPLLTLRMLMSATVDKLQDSAFHSMSAEDIRIFITPLESLIAEKVEEETTKLASGIDNVKITNADRKKDGGRSRRGPFGGEFVEEEEDFASRVNQEKAAKANEKLLASSGGLRAKYSAEFEGAKVSIGSVVMTVSRALELLAAISEGASRSGKEDALSILRTEVSVRHVGTYIYPHTYIHTYFLSSLLLPPPPFSSSF